ncbi:hypothetical protein [Limnobacter sp.]|uniref:hypothetical protein n=1 Tax=Limnobacter sp. TaxID=2003368 RepID=UPI0035132570
MGVLRQAKFGECACCGRYTPLTFHHLIPKKLHRRAYFKKHFNKQALNAGIQVCRTCHDGIHDLYTEMELAKRFFSLELLKADEALQRHFHWVSKQK